MTLSRTIIWMAFGCLTSLICCVAFGQNYPAKPIRIVTAEPGGGIDVSARLVASFLTNNLGQQVVIDNRGGAGGLLAARIVTRAPADGYTLLFYGSALWLLPYMSENIVPWDPVKDFSPITMAGSSPNMLVVHPSFPVNSVKELIAVARGKPGDLNYGSGGNGTTPHLAGALFASMAGINIVRVPYKGGGLALNALIGGQIQLMFPTIGLGIPHVQSGRLKALAITSALPSALAPGLPTIASTGLRDYESVLMVGVYAPPATHASLVNRLNREIVRILENNDVRQRFLSAGLEVNTSTPERLGLAVTAEISKWSKLIRDTGIRAD